MIIKIGKLSILKSLGFTKFHILMNNTQNCILQELAAPPINVIPTGKMMECSTDQLFTCIYINKVTQY